MFNDQTYISEINLKSKVNSIAYSASFICLLIFMGLFYQAAWQYPVNDSFPLIERLLNSNFLLNDFYTNTFSEFSPRLMLAKIVVGVSQLTGIHYTDVIAYGNIFRIWVYGIALYLFFLSLSDYKTALIAFGFSALSFLSMPFLPAWWPVTYDLTASNTSLLFAMLAWACTVKGHINSTFILLTIAVYFHPLAGLHGLLISLMLYFASFDLKSFYALLKQPLIYISGALFAIVFLSIYLSFDQVISDERFIDINGRFRHGHHYFFQHMDIEKWISTIILVFMCLYITVKMKLKTNISRIILTTIIFSVAMIVLNYVFIELFPSRFAYSLTPMRAFPILVPMVILSIALLAMQKFKEKDYISFYILFIPFLPYKQLGLTWYLLPNYHEVVLPTIAAIFSITFALLSRRCSNILKPVNNVIVKFIPYGNIAVAILPVAFVSLLLSIVRFEIKIPSLKTEAPIYQWLNDNTSNTDVIISELNAANNQKIRLIARRAVVVSKDFPFNEKFYEQWYRRYKDIYVERDKARGHVDALSANRLNDISDRYSATILLRSKPLEKNDHFSLLGTVMGEKAHSYVYRNNKVILHGH
jgi:hypothetical protein